MKKADLHINTFQNLLKTTYSSICSLQDTLLWNMHPLEQDPSDQTLQILHVIGCHWATLQIKGGNVEVYNTSFTTIAKETLATIAQLVSCKSNILDIQVMNTAARQSGQSAKSRVLPGLGKPINGILCCSTALLASQVCLNLCYSDWVTVALSHQEV